MLLRKVCVVFLFKYLFKYYDDKQIYITMKYRLEWEIPIIHGTCEICIRLFNCLQYEIAI